jgi:hypothetical protein
MRSLKVFGLSFFALSLMILIGVMQMSQDEAGGVFFLFVGTCTMIGLAIDMANHVKERIRKNNVRKLQP